MRAIGAGDRALASSLLDAAPLLATARLERADECFVAERHAQVYAGDTALPAAARAEQRTIIELLSRAP